VFFGLIKIVSGIRKWSGCVGKELKEAGFFGEVVLIRPKQTRRDWKETMCDVGGVWLMCREREREREREKEGRREKEEREKGEQSRERERKR